MERCLVGDAEPPSDHPAGQALRRLIHIGQRLEKYFVPAPAIGDFLPPEFRP
jgi:hypothetical protein